MLRKFINRTEELTSLNRDYQSKAFSFTVIYGRRRVGKTELIHNFQQDKPHIYFLADRRGTKSNLYRFRKKAADFFDDFEPSLETIDELFNYVLSIRRQSPLIKALCSQSFLIAPLRLN